MKSRKNNWYVITGGPGSGKTTLLSILQKQGFKIIPEMARRFIDQELKKGKTLEEIRKNGISFQKKILKLKVDLEKKLSQDEIIFFDEEFLIVLPTLNSTVF